MVAWRPGRRVRARACVTVRRSLSVTLTPSPSVMCGPDAARWSWNGSWTGCRAHWVHAVLPEHCGVPLVQVGQAGGGGVAMIRRRFPALFRKRASGCEEYSNIHRVTASAPQGALGALLDGYLGHRGRDQGVSGADASRGWTGERLWLRSQ